MKNKLIMRTPTSWQGQMWREGAPFGNGVIGGLVYGGIMTEIIALNHAYLWCGGSDMELPDISGCLPKIRQLLDEHNSPDADLVVTNELQKAGYNASTTNPCPLCDIKIRNLSGGIFKHYSRVVDMERAEVNVSWQDGEAKFTRSVFASRENQLVFVRLTADGARLDNAISLTLHDTETYGQRNIPNQLSEADAENRTLKFAAENKSVYLPGDFGAMARIYSYGNIKAEGSELVVSDASEIVIVLGAFVGKERTAAFRDLTATLERSFDYDAELALHTLRHAEFYSSVDFSISDSEKDASNAELLLAAYDDAPSNEFIEKLYAFGRYLFVTSTSDRNTLPCHLTGLYNGSWDTFWAFYMYNVNFEMIYWQALSGNLPGFLRLALDYTEAFIPDFRENAKKIFGCRGILINSVNTPESGLYKCLAPHIVNWTGGAAWFSQHFWDYYTYTGDEEYLISHALPFMYETALFYEDFAVENADGYLDLYPSVSPENTPSNIDALKLRGSIETTKNATMEFALLKELLTNLLTGCKITGMYPEKWSTWENMLAKIRPYRINSDGAVAEWIDPYYEDNYHHRHHSHVYPVFPGNEITPDDELYRAFERAEELRLGEGIYDQSSWSAVFMAGIAARMRKSDIALLTVETITRTCLMNNLLTLHNDWRRMGPVSCGDFRMVPFQIDANIGIPAVINEMLMQSQNGCITILPALPEKWEHGHITGLLARGNIICDIFWERDGGYAIFKSDICQKADFEIGSGYVFKDGTNRMSKQIDGNIRIEFLRK